MSNAALAWRERGSVVLCVVVFVALALRFAWRHVPLDDAFITFRYAQNLVMGHGLVFNPGEYVEGYSSLSWTLVIAGMRVLGVTLEHGARVAGLVLGAAIIALLGCWRATTSVRSWACLALATALPAAYHFINGLETALMTLLVTLLLRIGPGSGLQYRVGQLVVAGLVLTRPEGLLCVAIWLLADRVSGRRATGAKLLHLGATALVTALAQLAFRLGYYGEWVANSARAKLLPLGYALPYGLAQLRAFGWYAGGWGVLVAGALFAISRAWRTRTADALQVRCGVMFLAALLPVLAASGGDSFPLWRYYVPTLPLLCVLGAQGLCWLIEAIAERGWMRRLLGHAVALSIFLSARVTAYSALEHSISLGWEPHFARIGAAIAQQVRPDARLALCAVGAIPYMSRLYTIDMLGLTEPYIARMPPDFSYDDPGHHRHAGRHVLDRRPDLILLANGPRVQKPTTRFPWQQVRMYERDIVADPRFAREYVLAHLPLQPRGFVQMFVRKDFLTN